MTDPVRSAATVILWRDGAAGIEVLMGQRGSAAVFMPSKYVFPGGGVDPVDHTAPLTDALGARCAARLGLHVPDDAPAAGVLATAALRELTEETGLSLTNTDAALRFVFRAITPPGRSRRFDARFFLVPVTRLDCDPDDFVRASGELSHLHWISTDAARQLDLPFVTEIVLAEIAAAVSGAADQGVPFFDNSGDRPVFRRLV